MPGTHKYPPAEPEVLRLLAPQRGLAAIAKSKAKNQEDYEQQTPGTVKLWESPGRAGGLPGLNYAQSSTSLTVLGVVLGSWHTYWCSCDRRHNVVAARYGRRPDDWHVSRMVKKLIRL